jgi:hypothetical protein
MTEREFFKAMEAGQLMTSEVLPKLTKRMREVARENGALDKAMQSVNSEQQRFNTQLALAKKEFFDGGFGEAMAHTFRIMTEFLKTTDIKAFGAFFGGVIRGVADSLQLLTLPIKNAVNLMGMLFGESGSKWIGYGLGAAFLASKLYLVTKAMKAVVDISKLFGRTPIGFVITAAAALGGSFLLDKYLTDQMAPEATQTMQPQKPSASIAQQYSQPNRTASTVNVIVQPDGSEFGRAVKATYAGERYAERTNTVAELVG